MMDEIIVIDDSWPANTEAERERVRQLFTRSFCCCPGNTVPFDCPVHGAVENPNWPMLKELY